MNEIETAPQTEIRTKEDLIKIFKSARRANFASIAPLSHQDMELAMHTGSTVKNVIVHYVEWDHFEVFRTNQLRAGEEIDFWADEDYDAFNDLVAEVWKGRTVGQAIVEFGESTEIIAGLLERLPEEEIFRERRFGGRVIRIADLLVEAKHDQDHADEIEKWKEEVGINEYQQTS